MKNAYIVLTMLICPVSVLCQNIYYADASNLCANHSEIVSAITSDTTSHYLSQKDAKKIAKIFLKNKLHWKVYMLNKPYKAQLNGDYWTFQGMMLIYKKPRHGSVTVQVNIYDGSTNVIFRK
jgi:hypothetical protein